MGFHCQVFEGHSFYKEDVYSPREDDIIVPITEDVEGYRYRSLVIVRASARSIDPELVATKKWENRLTTEEDHLYCVIGEKDGKTVIQGGSSLGADSASRRNHPSCFKVVFDANDTADEYLSWLQEKPYEALNSVFGMVFAQYDQQGKFVKTLFPLEANSSIPYARPVDQVLVKDLRVA